MNAKFKTGEPLSSRNSTNVNNGESPTQNKNSKIKTGESLSSRYSTNINNGESQDQTLKAPPRAVMLTLQAVLLPLPAVLINTVVIGVLLMFLTNISFWIAAIGVMTGQALSCYGLGVPLFLLLNGYMRIRPYTTNTDSVGIE
jgi:hypothetical protein